MLTIVFRLISIVCRWIIFSEFGEEGWKSLIPLYSDYILFTIACSPLYFWLYIASLLAMLVGAFATGSILVLALFFVASLVLISIPLFAIFLQADEMKTKISVIAIFVLEVVLSGGSALLSFLG